MSVGSCTRELQLINPHSLDLLTTFLNSVTSAALARYDVIVRSHARIVELRALLVESREKDSERQEVGL